MEALRTGFSGGNYRWAFGIQVREKGVGNRQVDEARDKF